MNKKQLLQAKATKLDAMKAIQTAASANGGRPLTDEERTTFQALRVEVEQLNQDIANSEFLEEQERKAPAASTARADLPEAGKKPWESLGEQLTAVAAHYRTQGRVTDPRLLAALGANESVPAEGGFLVAPEFSAEIVQRTYDVGALASRCYQQPMTSNRLMMNAVDEDSRADGQRWGGIQAYWEAEAQNYVGTKPKFRNMEIIAHKLIGLCYATEEQLEDGPALEAYIAKAFPDEFSFKVDDAILNGSGAGMPLGILNSGAVLVIPEDQGQAAKTVTVSNILNMYTRMFARSRATAAWFINQDVEPQLYPLALQNPTGAILYTGPLYVPPGTRGNEYGLLMNKPVIPVEQCATLGTTGDIVLADCGQYILGKKGGLRADSSIHVAFLTGEMAFRFMLRTDGQPMWKKPLTPKNGVNTLSPFIALATRA